MSNALESTYELNGKAHTAWENGNYAEAKQQNEEAKSILTTFAHGAEDRNSANKIQKIITSIDEEITQIKKEERQRFSFINTLRSKSLAAAVNETPPADPHIWAPLPPKPPRRTIGQKKDLRTNTIGRPLVDRVRKPSKADETCEFVDPEAQERNALVEKWTLTGQYERSLVENVLSMMREGPCVSWADILGLEGPKEVFRQAVILPSLLPDFFKGIRRPAGSVLLFGPPGSGKTLLAKAAASESKTTFFLVQTADLASKWRGDAEKLVKLLFAIARDQSPSTIFFDEIDSIGSQRGAENEHEASRRLKSQLLLEIEDSCKSETERILILGATNFPWHIDEALLRRFEKRLFINLPGHEARKVCLQKSLETCPIDESIDFEAISAQLEGYSPADITVVCRHAALAGVSRLTQGMTMEDILKLKNDELQIPVTLKDIQDAIGHVKSSVNASSLQKYVEWYNKFGSA